MLLAELAAGVHPLALPDGSFPTPDQIRSELAQRRVDLSIVHEPRRRLLCQGLLTRDRQLRWGAGEVERWCAGQAPAIRDDAAGPAGSYHSVYFAGEDIDTPADLASAFQAGWDEALEHLYQDRDSQLVDETVALCKAYNLTDAAETARHQPGGAEVIRQFCRLLRELHPGIQPTFDGIDLRPAGLEPVARAVAEGDTAMAERLAVIQRNQILTSWRHLPGMADAAAIDKRWAQLIAVTRAAAGSLPLSPADRARIDGYLLLGAIDGHHLDDCRHEVEHLGQELAGERPWWAALAAGTGATDQVIALVSYPTAHAEAVEARQVAHQEELIRQAQAQQQAAEARQAAHQQELARQAQAHHQAEVEAQQAREREIAEATLRRRHTLPIIVTEGIGSIGIMVGLSGFARQWIVDEMAGQGDGSNPGDSSWLWSLYESPAPWMTLVLLGALTLLTVTAGRLADPPRHNRLLGWSKAPAAAVVVIVAPVWPLVLLIGILGFWPTVAAIGIAVALRSASTRR